jgi:hypothetical protein
MEGDPADELPLLEEVDAPALDERVIADEESRRDSRDTPLRQTPVIQSIHCGCYLGQMINVKQVARKLWNAVFDPKVRQRASSTDPAAAVAAVSHCGVVLRCGAALSTRRAGGSASSASVSVRVSIWQGDQHGSQE